MTARAVLGCLLASLAAGPALAQEDAAGAAGSRAAEIARLQAEKAKRLQPYEPSSLEKWAVALQEKFLAPQGVYPAYGGLYSGGGFQLGVGYRMPFRDHDTLDVQGVISLSEYKRAEIAYTARDVGTDALALRFNVGFRDAPSLSFHGVGNDSRPEPEANALVQEVFAGIGGRLGGRRGLSLDGHLGLLDHTSARGRGSEPQIEEAFDPAAVPGLGADPDYLVGGLALDLDTRDTPLYARAGGHYRIGYSRFRDREDGAYDFGLLELEGSQKFPILRGLWVLALRAEASGVDSDGDDVVPWYKLPYVGGGSSARGYGSYRFRDRHHLVMSAEWWWLVNRAIDMAVFYDAGKVGAEWSDLDFEDLHTDWGIGFRLHTPASPLLRIDVAHGEEGWHVVWAVSQAF